MGRRGKVRKGKEREMIGYRSQSGPFCFSSYIPLKSSTGARKRSKKGKSEAEIDEMESKYKKKRKRRFKAGNN